MNKVYDDKQQVATLLNQLRQLDAPPTRLMEVCGTHTMSIARYGLRSLLPPWLKLVSGPGCPVCVTDASVVSAALALAAQPEIIITSFGDMLRVPAGESSLLSAREAGADVRIVLSPLEALAFAEQQPAHQVVFRAVGFETTAPLIASTLQLAKQRRVDNFSIIPAHKTMPQALGALLGGKHNIDGLLCPGHVAAITGPESFAFVPQQHGVGAAIAGFGAAEILAAVLALARMRCDNKAELVNCYTRVVRPGGNPHALAAMNEVFIPTDAVWRGLGGISNSGLALSPAYAEFDAIARFAEIIAGGTRYQDDPACCCGAVLRGELASIDCPLFGRRCTPEHPVGACMVSSEGACAATWRYREQ